MHAETNGNGDTPRETLTLDARYLLRMLEPEPPTLMGTPTGPQLRRKRCCLHHIEEGVVVQRLPGADDERFGGGGVGWLLHYVLRECRFSDSSGG